uniref:Trifunctional enzyme subunit alpha, mitochondrial n=2 Tax=Grammatophora oceanica TaxID=210454 RepID=A0A7S1YNE5_9STRA|mmetsp:Transcript_8555/g.12494  ORF Transcript_8555/g.12494 Transcript_8555/m.12494 type:complete len:797 (+) Transcript_8555:130-2520(+)|eukprot:CAMPEP_0194046256 /NCGR_PEP_ID=MMETSP0009_2-20130614/20077_1 /TAXON_ID=210454 /ORGANISM="Grammatophora oceanica, Strain CCMP 410" /LENGTH=796 /DNA_ID=CAMNT_0038691465 /DNA_START=95 /DNA_END=2485 /DNA_ORIENTATION=-
MMRLSSARSVLSRVATRAGRGSASLSSTARMATVARFATPTPTSTTIRYQSTAAAAATPTEETTPKATTPTPFVSTAERKYEYFENVELTPEGVAVIRFDCPGKPVNTISFALKDEAKVLWNQEIDSNGAVKAVVFSSAKPNMFIAGADIFDIKSIEDKSQLVPLIEDGLDFFQSMKKKGIPLVCAIDGPALGGGLEWALWCDYRVCSDSKKTKLGLPEVKLGLLPGFGGTQNLHKLVGLQAAMDMMLTGKDIRPKKAKKMGLVDLVVAPQSVESVAIECASQLADGTLKAKIKKKSWMNWAIEDTPMGRNMMWQQIDKMVEKNAGGNYPAPLKIIEAVQYGLQEPKKRYQKERELFAELAATKESEALIGIFDGMTQMKKHSFGKDAAIPVKTVAVMGAGLMGAGIAQVSAEKGLSVLLKDTKMEGVARGQAYMQDNWKKKVSRKRMTQYEYNIHSSNVTPLTDSTASWKRHFGQADLIIEAVFEDLDLKRKIVADVEAVTPDHTIFATNTSAIPISDIAVGAKRPEQIIGMHYFSPVPQMPLLEIIPHDGTSDSTKATALEVGTKQGKTCILVKDVPGFYVNRCLGPFLVEVSALVRDGVDLETLDKSMKKFGMPVGPITLADEVGIDVTSHVASFLSNADLGQRMDGGNIAMMQNMVDKGWLGKKSNKGFYSYDGKKKTINPDVKAYLKDYVQPLDRKLEMEEIQDRMVSRFVNEAAKCLEDDIIENPVVGDIGLVFGTGFAPFRGGPFRYLDQVGVASYVDKMHKFADNYGAQFEPCQLLQDYAATDKKFHS